MIQANPRRGCLRFEDRLEALVGQAFELGDSPYFRDAVDAIVDTWDRRGLTAFEHRQQQRADLKRLLRETDPARPRRAA
jgi:hypothetical protein